VSAAVLPAAGGRPLALVKGAGDLATGVAVRLSHSGFAVVMTELARPTVIRRTVSFAEAVYAGRTCVEDVEAARADDVDYARGLLAQGVVPIIIDPDAAVRLDLRPLLLVDAVIAKRNTGTGIGDAPAVVALGPGFEAGRDAHAVIETSRGHRLGRVMTSGSAAPDTGIPGEIGGYTTERLLRAPAAGVFRGVRQIGDIVTAGEVVAYVGDEPVRAQIGGVLRGLLYPGLEVTAGLKIGDVDPRAERRHCYEVSDKALAIAGGVIEAACMLLGGIRFAAADSYTAHDGRRADISETRSSEGRGSKGGPQ
jgi:xanthine dehydrogenase accessory factor